MHREIPNTILVLQITNFFTIELIGTWDSGMKGIAVINRGNYGLGAVRGTVKNTNVCYFR